MVDSAAVIEHDFRIHSFTHTAPGAFLGGGVTVGERTPIAAEAVVNEGVTTGSRASIGFGAAVVYNPANRQTIVGVSARGANEN